MDKAPKTNVMRLLEQAGVPYRVHLYPFTEDDPTGRNIPHEEALPREQVFKTLVTRGAKGGVLVFCIPVDSELDLKKAARAAGEKSVEMTHLRELTALTGYVRGGCSPMGKKKQYPTVIDETAVLWDEIAVSGGKRGCQIILPPQELARCVGGAFADLTAE